MYMPQIVAHIYNFVKRRNRERKNPKNKVNKTKKHGIV